MRFADSLETHAMNRRAPPSPAEQWLHAKFPTPEPVTAPPKDSVLLSNPKLDVVVAITPEGLKQLGYDRNSGKPSWFVQTVADALNDYYRGRLPRPIVIKRELERRDKEGRNSGYAIPGRNDLQTFGLSTLNDAITVARRYSQQNATKYNQPQ
jgi:hypothetical protein